MQNLTKHEDNTYTFCYINKNPGIPIRFMITGLVESTDSLDLYCMSDSLTYITWLTAYMGISLKSNYPTKRYFEERSITTSSNEDILFDIGAGIYYFTAYTSTGFILTSENFKVTYPTIIKYIRSGTYNIPDAKSLLSTKSININISVNKIISTECCIKFTLVHPSISDICVMVTIPGINNPIVLHSNQMGHLLNSSYLASPQNDVMYVSKNLRVTSKNRGTWKFLVSDTVPMHYGSIKNLRIEFM